MVIQHNLTAMNSNRQLGITTGLQAKSSEKLSSGYKINRAADDAAGLAISEKMRRQIRGLDQASNNVQDGISYVQVADAALAEIDDMLARMTELCVQAANDTLTPEDRSYIDSEIQQLKVECNRTFHTTSFNEKLIWDENTTDRKVVGTEDRPIYTWSNNNYNYYEQVTDQNAGAWPANRGFDIIATDSSVKLEWTGFDGKTYESNEISWPSEDVLKSGFDLSLTSSDPAAAGIEPQLRIYLDDDATLSQMVSELNGKKIHASSDLSLSGTVTGDTGYSYVTGNLNYITGLVYRNNMAGSEDRMNQEVYSSTGTNRGESVAEGTPDPESTMNFKFSFGKRGSDTDRFIIDAGYNARVYTSTYTRDSNAKGIWWGEYSTGGTYSSDRSQAPDSVLKSAITTALGTQTSQAGNQARLNDYGGYLHINFSLTSESELSYGTGSSKLGTDTGGAGQFELVMRVEKGETTESVLERVKNITGVELTNSSTHNMSMYNSTSSYFKANIYAGTMQLNIQAGSESNDDNIIPLIYDVLNNHSLGINAIGTQTRETSLEALEKVKSAAKIVDEQRAVFGAYQNRMEHAYKNLTNTVENTQHAESVIRDTDMAAEMVKYSNNNILAQAGQSILAQANQTNQGVLSLLQ